MRGIPSPVPGLPLVLGLAACHPEFAPPPQFDPLSVSVEGVEDTGEEVDAFSAGTIRVEAEGEDTWRLVFPDSPDYVVVASTGADLSGLDGVNATAHAHRTVVGGFPGSEPADLVVADADGPRYLAVVYSGPDFANEVFGRELVHVGPVYATTQTEDFDWEFSTLAFDTDDGVVEIEPGAVETVRIDGWRWRVGVVTSFESDHGGWRRRNEMLICYGSPESVHAFEMLRLDEDEELPEPPEPPVSARMMHFGGC